MGRFFYTCRRYAEGDLNEFILRRYGAAYETIMRMPLGDFVQFMDSARKAQEDERLYLLFCTNFTKWKPEYQNFRAFRDVMTGANIDRRSDADILAEVARIEKELKLTDGDVTV